MVPIEPAGRGRGQMVRVAEESKDSHGEENTDYNVNWRDAVT
jgi:hypothetical protein